MRIVQITPGTGNFHCGNCLRDTNLVSALRRMGHEVLMAPMYLPHVTDGADLSDTPVFFGGINAYLQQKSWIFRHTPRWIDRLLDGTSLLRWAADRAGMTRAADLGQITVSMLRGEDGAQAKELSRLVEFLRHHGRLDVVSLSNALLMGLARRIRREVGAKVVCTLAGEDAFLDSLIEPYRTQAWGLMRERAADVDCFIPVSHYYARLMGDRMSLERQRMRIVHNGVDPGSYGPPAPPAAPVIGYMAAMHPGKGLGVLVEAFIRLCRGGRVPGVRLHAAGAVTPRDQPFVAQQRRRLEAQGLGGRFEFRANITAQQKHRFLASTSVVSIPAVYGETFGLYVLEAWASGVPVVEPEHAAFPELIERGGGGILCRLNDPVDLAEALESVLRDPAGAAAMGQRGRRAVEEYFNVDRMTREVLEVFSQDVPRAGHAMAQGESR